jgi:site-specific DNA-adenine methylase
VDNNIALVYVGQGNTFEMLGSAELMGNYNASTTTAAGESGGAVRVSGGIFRMTGDDTKVRYNYAGHYGAVKGKVEYYSLDYKDIFEMALPGDIMYMDPPYQGVCGERDSIYFSGIEHEEFVKELKNSLKEKYHFW